jgi:hypothetical protein
MDPINEAYMHDVSEAISNKDLMSKSEFVVVKTFNAQHQKVPNDYDIEKGTVVKVINYTKKWVSFTTDTHHATKPDVWSVDINTFRKSTNKVR